MKGYESYNLSNIEGIKEVPSHWKPIKLKFIGNLYSGLSGKSGNDFYNEDNPLSRPYINFKNIANNVKINPNQFDLVEIKPHEEQNQVRKGDLFFLMSSENYDDIAKTSVLVEDLKETYLNSFCRGFRLTDENFVPEFLNYLLLSGHYREILSNEAKGFTRINIQVGKINNFSIYAPFDKEEQTQIAVFLDYKTSLIDATIQKKKRLIELLKEKRQTVINEAVTKGLNPNAPMKDSGVEWLGEIPEHWEKLKIGRAFNLIGSGTTPNTNSDIFYNNGKINWLNTGDLNDSYIIETKKKITEIALKETSLRIFPVDCIVIALYGATIGKLGHLKIATTTNQACCVLSNSKSIINRFLFYYFLSSREHIISMAYGGGQPNISQELIKQLYIPTPSLEEQDLIVSTLDELTLKIDNTILKIENQIENLQTYRQSLISEAVTGKIDVRDWQKPKN